LHTLASINVINFEDETQYKKILFLTHIKIEIVFIVQNQL